MKIKTGDLTEDSISDFDEQKVKYVDKDGYGVASESSKVKLASPQPLDIENND